MSRWRQFVRGLGRWLFRWLRRTAYALVALALVFALLVWLGVIDRWARAAIVSRVEQMTGGAVELAGFHFDWWDLRAELDGFVLRGREPEGTEPFFRADRLVVDIRVDSLLRRKISLDEVRLERPQVHVRFDEAGRSNVPQPPVQPASPGTPLRQRIFDLAIREVRIENGEMLFNNVRLPLVAEGGEFRFAFDYHADGSGGSYYTGDFAWQQMALAARRYLPFSSNLAARFTLTRENFTLDEFRWSLPDSELTASASLSSFATPAWDFRYQGRLSLGELREILRKPRSPLGRVNFSGVGRWAGGELDLNGSFDATGISMAYDWYTATGMSARSTYHASRHRLDLPDFQARALGGSLAGPVQVELQGMRFRASTRMQGMDLASLLAAADHRGVPTATLHWDGTVDLQAITTWELDFKNVDSRGTMLWSPPLAAREGYLPASAKIDYHYSLPGRFVELRNSEISTPSSRLEFNGLLGARDSALTARVETSDLAPWNDFIYALRGPDAERVPITGGAEFNGRMTGRLDHPSFTGRVRGTNAAYGHLHWDEIAGDLSYSPDALDFTRARARRGQSTAELELHLALDRWSFRDESAWSATAELVRAPLDGLQSLFGVSYPVTGLLTGQFRGSGTRAEPELTGLVDISEVHAWGFPLDRARGQIVLRRDEVRINNAELRKATGRLTGDFRYGFHDRQSEFDLTGAVIPLDQFQFLQTAALPVGGQLSFQVQGRGPLPVPALQGSLRLVDLKVGDEVLGSFQAQLQTRNGSLLAELSSFMTGGRGRLNGQLEVALSGDYPFSGYLQIDELDLDPLVVTALRLRHGELTGHSTVSGRLGLSGFIARPKTLAVQADLTRFGLNYKFLQLENDGPLRFSYSAEEIRVEQAHIRGPDTDFTLTGFARLAGDRRVDLDVAGQFNLQLLGGLVPSLDARGRAQVNMAVEGTAARPRLLGRIRLEDGSATYGEFPTGLSRVNGSLVFNETRLLLEDVSAEAGGGRLRLGGTVTYGEGPARYDLTIAAAKTRVRYPVGMSWLLNGDLRLAGNLSSALLSGNIQIERLLLSEGFDFATLLPGGSGRVAGPRATSPFLRNLQFDISAHSIPGARIEWSQARFESEAQLRVRGTWEHPILLGNIRLFTGEMGFRGNRYQLTRGEIVFSDPLAINPTLHIEAVTTVQQYEVTLTLLGPANKLNLAYRSDPPLPPADVVALLALGRTGADELRTTGATESGGAQALLYEALSSQVGGRIEQLFGFSRFKVEPVTVGTGSEQNATARITIQEAITRDLIVTYITTVSSNQRQVIQIEYLVDRDISVIALLDQNGTFGIDFKIKKRFR
jgi:translocation and assembly module TamB